MPHGKKAASKTPMDAYVDGCRATSISTAHPTRTSRRSSSRPTSRPAMPRVQDAMSGRRPVVKGRFEGTVNVSGAVMSSAFDADEMAPLALMIRPPGSSPPSFQRARSGAGVLSGFQAFAVGSHHFVGALDFQPRLAARIPLAEPVAVVRPQLAGRRIGRPSSSARRRCARPCWRARPRSA